MEALATLSDLDAFHVDHAGRDDLALRLLESVSAEVRAAAMHPISRTSVTVTVPAGQSRRLLLPARPVLSVESVAIDGTPVTDWRLVGDALWRDSDWAGMGRVPTPVRVAFTCGYDPVPPDIVRLVVSFVAAGLTQDADGGPGAHRGLAYERVDDAQFGYQQGAAEVVDASALPDATRRYLRSRFGGSITDIEVLR